MLAINKLPENEAILAFGVASKLVFIGFSYSENLFKNR